MKQFTANTGNNLCYFKEKSRKNWLLETPNSCDITRSVRLLFRSSTSSVACWVCIFAFVLDGEKYIQWLARMGSSQVLIRDLPILIVNAKHEKPLRLTPESSNTLFQCIHKHTKRTAFSSTGKGAYLLKSCRHSPSMLENLDNQQHLCYWLVVSSVYDYTTWLWLLFHKFVTSLAEKK